MNDSSLFKIKIVLISCVEINSAGILNPNIQPILTQDFTRVQTISIIYYVFKNKLLYKLFPYWKAWIYWRLKAMSLNLFYLFRQNVFAMKYWVNNNFESQKKLFRHFWASKNKNEFLNMSDIHVFWYHNVIGVNKSRHF